MSVAKLGDIAEQVRGVSYSKADAMAQKDAGLVPILRANNITENGLVFTDLVYVPEKYVRPNQYIIQGDVMIAASSGSIDVVGKAGEARTHFRGSFGAFCKVLRPNQQKVNPVYFAHFFKTTAYRRRISSLAAGANINNLKNEHLDDLEIPLPPLDEQKWIAATLDKADALRAKRRQAIALLDSLTQSIFLEMFGDPVSNPKGWPLATLGDLGALERGVSKHRPRNDPKLLGGQHPLIQTGDVSNSGGYIRSFTSTYSDFGLAQSRLWPVETLCITITANIASTGILRFASCFPDSVVGFRSSTQGMAQYVRVWMSFLKETLERTAPAVAQKNINLAILRELQIPLPPEGHLRKFDTIMNGLQADQERFSLQQQKSETLFASLQHRAFSGQL